MSEIRNNRLEELLIDRATDVLSETENDELQSLLQQEQLQDDFSYEELVAGMQDTYLNTEVSPLPDRIRSSVISQAESLMQGDRLPENPSASVIADKSSLGKEEVSIRSRREMLAWLATAASLAIAAFLWATGSGTAPLPLIQSSTQAALNDFVAGSNAADTFTVSLNDPVSGPNKATVYWNRKLKKGFLKVGYLAENDPTKKQYQLWIIDGGRGMEDRPNAGVFDVSKDGDNVFEFRSDLAVDFAQGFAITEERPGGVAVSDLKRVPLINAGQ